jgi:hypothetical protein
MRWKAVLGATLTLLATTCSAYADRYSCDAVVNGAQLGVFRNNAVSVAIDFGKRECRFSVNGATVGSPPLDRVLQGLNAIADGKMLGLLRESNREPLAYALLAASRLDGVPSILLTRLRDFSEELVHCFSDFYERKIGLLVSKGDSTRCTVIGPRREIARIGQLLIVNDGPQLQLMVVLEDQTLHLFVPLNYRQGLPPLQP